MVEAVRKAADRGAIISAHCTAAWLLGDAGLLDGRECTTHWRYADRLAEAFPKARVTPDVLYVFDGNILTGAGAAGGIDAALHLMRRTFGARTAATTARRMVVPPHRDGGQAQFVRTPMGQTEADTLAPLLAWASERLDEPMPVERLAAEAHMSPRTFARRFRDETGTTPLQWLTGQRLALAEELLENSTLSVEQIASRVGFGNAATLRHHFTASRGTTPQAYRKTFTCVEEVRSPRGRCVAPCRSRCGAARRRARTPWVAWAERGARRAVAQHLLVDVADVRRAHPLAPALVGTAEDGDVLEAGRTGEGGLDLGRVDVDAAGDDQVRAPRVQPHQTVLDASEVADGERGAVVGVLPRRAPSSPGRAST